MVRADRVVLAGLIVLAVAVRFATLDHQSFDHDEAVTAIRVLHANLGDTLSVVGHLERNPPLYYVLAWLWSQLFGVGEVGLRSLSALAGALTVLPAYLTAREFSGRRAGIIAGCLVAVNPFLVWYSQEARSYAVFVLFAAWALYFFVRAVREPTRRNLGFWALASALALCSHYFAVFLIVPQGAWLLRTSRPRRGAILAVGAVTAAGLALAPLAAHQQSSNSNNFIAGASLGHRAAQTAVEFVAGQEPGPLSGSPPVDLLQVAAVAVTCLVVPDRPRLAATRRAAATARRRDSRRRRPRLHRASVRAGGGGRQLPRRKKPDRGTRA